MISEEKKQYRSKLVARSCMIISDTIFMQEKQWPNLFSIGNLLGILASFQDSTTLKSQLSAINIRFDVIGMSESKQQLDKSFLVNVNIKSYSMYTQPTKSSCGGCAIYVKSQLDHHVSDDLSVLKDDFETRSG